MEVINLWKGCVVRFRMLNNLKGLCKVSHPSNVNSVTLENIVSKVVIKCIGYSVNDVTPIKV